MSADWSVPGLLNELAARGAHPAIILAGEGPAVEWDCATLAARVRAVAMGLKTRHGVAVGTPVAIQAPNHPAWVAAALGILAAGGVLVPLDDLADAAQVTPGLHSSGAKLLFTTPAHLAAGGEALRQAGVQALLLEQSAPQAAAQDRERDLPTPAPEDPAALLATSGTTGAAKTFFLSHRNIGGNVEALAALGIIGASDHVLLPLPLHHAYPLIVGMLTTLTVGSTLVLPSGVTGPVIMRAAHDGGATVIVGVPRLFDAIVSAIDARIGARSWPIRSAALVLLRASAAVQRAVGFSPGRLLFASARRSVAPSLRLLVSGGARLERSTEDRLEGIGWTVLSGYGLAETASIFTGNRPNQRRRGSAGLPLGTGRVRITDPDADGIGEILLRGPSITAGYIDNPQANHATFTEDGWFRTGDLGYLDHDDFLYITGRTKEVLVLGDGKKVNPEELERVYGQAPQIQEIAVLQQDGALVALVRPERGKLFAMGATNIRDGIRVVLAERARDLPSHERLSGFALTDEPLPRTRLGKYRRFLLRDLYARALAGLPARALEPPSPQDLALLADPTASAVWALLQARQPDRALDLDMNPGLDLGFDSFAWMELTVALQERCGVRLTEADIARVVQLRDLLRLAIERRAGGTTSVVAPAPIATDIDRWLAPTGVLHTAAGLFLYALNFAVIRGLFGLRVEGVEYLPEHGAFVLTPNHVSDLDAMAIAAALPLSRLWRLYWAGDIVRLFYNAASRQFCRIVHLFPVDETHPFAAVETALRVLAADKAQVWFPEGWRSPDGRLQRFLPGIGQVLLRSKVPAVPAYIDGAFEALPRGRRIPRFRRITIVIGAPVTADALRTEALGGTDEERVAWALRARVRRLGQDAGFTVEDAEMMMPLVGQKAR